MGCVIKRGVVKIRDKQELLLVTDGIVENNDAVNSDAVMESIKEELDDHRVAINENTTEIEANYEYFRALEKKIDILSKLVSELTLAGQWKKETKAFSFAPLSVKEKKVFSALYEQTQIQPFTTYNDLAKKLDMSDSLVASYVTNMLEKGVPIIKKYSEGVAYLKLDDEFRQIQAKKNIVGVNSLLSYWL